MRYNLASVRAYLLKQQFQQLWHYASPIWAGKFLDAWCTQTMRSKIEPMKKFARTVRAHRELLLNYFRARKQFSSGVIEGLNNKAKVGSATSGRCNTPAGFDCGSSNPVPRTNTPYPGRTQQRRPWSFTHSNEDSGIMALTVTQYNYGGVG